MSPISDSASTNSTCNPHDRNHRAASAAVGPEQCQCKKKKTSFLEECKTFVSKQMFSLKCKVYWRNAKLLWGNATQKHSNIIFLLSYFFPSPCLFRCSINYMVSCIVHYCILHCLFLLSVTPFLDHESTHHLRTTSLCFITLARTYFILE